MKLFFGSRFIALRPSLMQKVMWEILSRLLEGIKYHKDNVFIIYWLHTPNQLAIAIISECLRVVLQRVEVNCFFSRREESEHNSVC